METEIEVLRVARMFTSLLSVKYIYIYICIYIYNFLSAGKRLFKVIDESTIVNTSAKLISILLKLNGIS